MYSMNVYTVYLVQVTYQYCIDKTDQEWIIFELAEFLKNQYCSNLSEKGLIDKLLIQWGKVINMRFEAPTWSVFNLFFKGGWYMGSFACNVWLGVDYVASNASVLNLLIICIDRLKLNIILN